MATNLKNQVALATSASSSIGEAVQPLGYRAIPRHPVNLEMPPLEGSDASMRQVLPTQSPFDWLLS